MDNSNLEQSAFEWVKQNKRLVIEKFADPLVHSPESEMPVSLFMAGSPGAGKTETSQLFVSIFNNKPVRIDADEIRAMCPGYEGINSSVFNKASDKGVNLLFDYCIDKKLNFILDTTFAYAGAADNIQRCLNAGRIVQIFFIYQDPKMAWIFTKARESVDRRHVPIDAFIDTYFKSQENVNQIKELYKDRVKLHIIIKDIGKSPDLKLNIDKIDSFIHIRYNQESLRSELLAINEEIDPHEHKNT